MKKILLVDDDADFADTVKSILENKGYDVIVAYDAQKGIDIAKKEKPDLILMDIMFQGMNGGEAIKILQSDKNYKETSIVFFSSLFAAGKKILREEGLMVDGPNFKIIPKSSKIDKFVASIIEIAHE